MRNYLFALAFPLLLAGQPPLPSATLEGTVIDSTTGQPVVGARLSFWSEMKAITGSDGRFRIAGIRPGTYTLSTSRALFLTTTQKVKLENGQTLANWQVELARPLEISGKVEDQDGWPVDGCMIQTLRYAYRDGKRKLEPQGSVQCNDLGEYWVGGLEPGRYYVRALPFGAFRSWDDRYGTTYYPAAANVSDAGAVDLAPGEQHAGVNIRMMRRQGVRLTGEVVLPESGASRYRGVWVSLDCEDMNVNIHGQFSNGGRGFTIRDVPPGSYTLRARVEAVSTPEGPQPLLAAYQRVEVGTSDLSGFVLKLQPQTPRDIAATVTVESKTEMDALQFHLQPGYGSTITERLKSDGSLVFRNIPPGRYRYLHASQWRFDATMLYLKSARLGEEDILGREFDIPSESSGPLQLTLGVVSMARVQGVVTDWAGHPAAEATVALVPTNPRIPYSPRTDLADQTGAFIFSAPEGEYRVFAWKTAPPSGSIDDPEFLQGQNAQTVVLKPGVNPTLKLSLAR